MWMTVSGVISASMRSSAYRSEEHTSELQSHLNLVCRLLLEKKKNFFNPSAPTYKPQRLSRDAQNATRVPHASHPLHARQPAAGHTPHAAGHMYPYGHVLS